MDSPSADRGLQEEHNRNLAVNRMSDAEVVANAPPTLQTLTKKFSLSSSQDRLERAQRLPGKGCRLALLSQQEKSQDVVRSSVRKRSEHANTRMLTSCCDASELNPSLERRLDSSCLK